MNMSLGKILKIGVPAALAGVFSLTSFGFADYAMGIKPQTLEEAWAWQADHYDVSWYQDTDPVEYTIESYDGYTLHVVLMHSLKKKESEAVSASPDAEKKSPERYVICSHGYTDNRYGTLKYAKIYLDLGCNVIAYDLRGHGKNEKTFCTYSARESKDLNCLIEDTYQRCGQDIVLGLHGESLGSATSIAVLGYTQKPAFVVADCGFADIENVLKGGLKAMNPALAFMLKPASLAAKLKYGYSFSEMKPVNALPENKVPILFIHGSADTFISPDNSKRMQEATGGYSELHLIPGAAHAKSILTDHDSYVKYVEEFLRKIDM